MANAKRPNIGKTPKPKSSSSNKKWIWGGGGTIFLLLVAAVLYPQQGSIQYGICRVFIELDEIYPESVKPLSVDDFIGLGGPVKITYKKIDPFGVNSVNTIECTFKRDVAGIATTELQKVDINGKSRVYNAESPDYVAKFNKGVSAILANPPSLDLPTFSLDNLSEYKDSE